MERKPHVPVTTERRTGGFCFYWNEAVKAASPKDAGEEYTVPMFSNCFEGRFPTSRTIDSPSPTVLASNFLHSLGARRRPFDGPGRPVVHRGLGIEHIIADDGVIESSVEMTVVANEALSRDINQPSMSKSSPLKPSTGPWRPTRPPRLA